MEPTPKPDAPKHSCMITLMFAIESDEEALHVKKVIDEAVKNITEKRYTFTINES